MKKRIAVLLALVMTFSLAACGAPASDSGEGSGQEDEQKEDTVSNDGKGISLTVFHYMVEASKQKGLDAVEQAFAEAHPEYDITWDNVFYNQGTDYFPQLQTALAGGEQPEVIMGNPGLYPDLVTQGYTADLTDNATIKSLDLPSGDMGDVSADGKIYGFPIDFKSWGVFYNKAIYEELDLEEPATYTELLDNCQKIAEAGYDPWVHAFGDAVFGDIEMRNYIWTKALEAGDKDLFENLMNGSKKLTDYTYFADGLELWAQRLQWMRDDAMTNDQNAALEVFTSGKAAMLYTGTWGIGDLEAMIEGSDFKYGFFVEPIDDDGSAKMNVQVDQSFMLNPNAENYEIALEFLEYWVTEGTATWSAISLCPALKGKVSDEMPDAIKSLVEIKASGEISHYGDFTMPFNTQFTTDWRTYLTAFAESYAKGQGETADECLNAMQMKFDQDIAEAE